VTRPDGANWVLAYNTAGELTGIADPLGHKTGYGYDAAHRMTTVTAPDGVTYVSNTYDDQGRVVRQVNGDGHTSTIAYNGDGTATYSDTTGAKTTFAMDGSGRVSKVTTPLHHVIETGYANWDTTSKTDANGHQTTIGYDQHGNAVEVANPAGEHQSFTYTSQGDLTSTTDPTGATTTFTIDGKGNTTAVAGPDGAHWQQRQSGEPHLPDRPERPPDQLRLRPAGQPHHRDGCLVG
jgi:YD repeat-containing protein